MPIQILELNTITHATEDFVLLLVDEGPHKPAVGPRCLDLRRSRRVYRDLDRVALDGAYLAVGVDVQYTEGTAAARKGPFVDFLVADVVMAALTEVAVAHAYPGKAVGARVGGNQQARYHLVEACEGLRALRCSLLPSGTAFLDSDGLVHLISSRRCLRNERLLQLLHVPRGT